MTARQLVVAGAMPSRDTNGRALPSKLRFYLPQTTTPAVVYTDSDLTVPHEWPVVSDDAGRWAQIWAEESTYFDVVWTDRATDSNIAAYADIRPLDDALAASATLAEAAADAAQAAAADADDTALEIAATIAGLGDFSEAAAEATAAAATATAAKVDAEAAAVAAAASAASINSQNILVLARAHAFAGASLL